MSSIQQSAAAATTTTSVNNDHQNAANDYHHRRRDAYMALDAYSRHKQFINDYFLFYGKPNTSSSTGTAVLPPGYRTERDIIRKHHRFVRSAEDDINISDDWEKRLSKKYYDKLFKEYCLAELKYYREGRIAMRWRTEQEVVGGKGQFSCGAMRCESKESLKSWEVNFGYVEEGVKKNALVKLRLCPRCSDRLNYTKQQQEQEQQKIKSKRKAASTDDSDGISKRVATTDSPQPKQAESAIEPSEKDKQHWKNTIAPTTSTAAHLGTTVAKAEEFDEFFKGLFD